MKYATLDLTPELFVEFAKFCKDGPPRRIVVKENPLPDDAEIVEVEMDEDAIGTYLLRLIVKSESFSDLPAPYPQLPAVVFETQYDEVSESTQ